MLDGISLFFLFLSFFVLFRAHTTSSILHKYYYLLDKIVMINYNFSTTSQNYSQSELSPFKSNLFNRLQLPQKSTFEGPPLRPQHLLQQRKQR